MLATRLWRVFGLQTEGEIADRGAVAAGDHPVPQEDCDACRAGEFKERECQPAYLDASEWEIGQSRCGKQKPKKSRQETEPY